MTEAKKVPTVVGVAASNDSFTTLVAAVKAADLVDTLNSDGPFT
ncbi:MAG: fasciclin domain-containing protein, partial [Parvularculaceae bacterium]|nr:fasciclin domain-containing protein [Parvularculaceae bacterium]